MENGGFSVWGGGVLVQEGGQREKGRARMRRRRERNPLGQGRGR